MAGVFQGAFIGYHEVQSRHDLAPKQFTPATLVVDGQDRGVGDEMLSGAGPETRLRSVLQLPLVIGVQVGPIAVHVVFGIPFVFGSSSTADTVSPAT